MGKIIEDLDIQINSIRMSYLQAVSRGNWQLAVHFIEMMHNAIPPKARISDFVKLEFDQNEFLHSNKVNNISIGYCMKWMPLIESAIAVHRDQMLRELNS